jgi:demethylmenaquinone methyltransferase/2-methoxy-6-polyprenyl-1,4-benzoquinol methylase
MNPPPLATRDSIREARFAPVWSEELNKVFADVAPYYDRANDIATLGLCDSIRRGFMATMRVRPHMRVLDVCAGTNANGIALLEREPTLEVHAIDRSEAMQEVGGQRARDRGLEIHSHIGDVHTLPFPDNHFDLVTLQFASRHLSVRRVFSEIHRVLKPGGRFHHCDMLRPANPVVERVYYTYLRFSLSFTAFLFGSGQAALNCRKYFVDALQMFYSSDELSIVLEEIGFSDVRAQEVLAGTVAYHSAAKPNGALASTPRSRPSH